MDVSVRWTRAGICVYRWPSTHCSYMLFRRIGLVHVRCVKTQMCWWDSRQLKNPAVRSPLIATPSLSDSVPNTPTNPSARVAQRPSLTPLRGLTPAQPSMRANTMSKSMRSSLQMTTSFSRPSKPVIISGATCVACVPLLSGQDHFLVPTESGDILFTNRAGFDVGGRRGSVSARPGVAGDGFGVYKGHVGPVSHVAPHPSLPGYWASAGDWTVRIWDARPANTSAHTAPVLTLGPLHAGISSVTWAAGRPNILYATLTSGHLAAWNVLSSQTQPLFETKVPLPFGGEVLCRAETLCFFSAAL
jgi:hypothetical protein